MSKITLSTKYLSKQNQAICIITGILLVVYLAFQFTNVGTVLKSGVLAKDAQNVQISGSRIDWKSADLMAKTIPDSIKDSAAIINTANIKDHTLRIAVFDDTSSLQDYIQSNTYIYI